MRLKHSQRTTITFDTNETVLSMTVMYENQMTGELETQHITDFANGAAILQHFGRQLHALATVKGNA
jgi:hypothetical protein